MAATQEAGIHVGNALLLPETNLHKSNDELANQAHINIFS